MRWLGIFVLCELWTLNVPGCVWASPTTVATKATYLLDDQFLIARTYTFLPLQIYTMKLFNCECLEITIHHILNLTSLSPWRTLTSEHIFGKYVPVLSQLLSWQPRWRVLRWYCHSVLHEKLCMCGTCQLKIEKLLLQATPSLLKFRETAETVVRIIDVSACVTGHALRLASSH